MKKLFNILTITSLGFVSAYNAITSSNIINRLNYNNKAYIKNGNNPKIANNNNDFSLGNVISKNKWTDNNYSDYSTTINEYSCDFGIKYTGYSNGWDFLTKNENKSFNLHKRFESRLGWAPHFKNYNYAFDKDEKYSFLEYFYQHYYTVTYIGEWNIWHNKLSIAKIDLKITDDTKNQRLIFTFRSFLQNENIIFDCLNYMY